MQFSCSDFLKVLFQLQPDTELKIKTQQHKTHSSLENKQPKATTNISTDYRFFRTETASELQEGCSDTQL